MASPRAAEPGETSTAVCPEPGRLLRYATGRVDDATRAELEAHLATCTSCRASVAAAVDELREAKTIAARDLPDQRPTTPVASPRTPPPEKVGRYLVLELLGAGGMGEVVLAYDPVLDRRVAIKMAHRPPDDTAGMLEARLRREAQSLARVVDPGVVSVYDAGTFEGRPFVAMEYVPGTTLKRWLKDAKRSRAEVLRLFLQAANGLAAAHAAGVVHRDFKPDNVLVDAKGNARVTDFGLASLQGAPGEARPVDGVNVAHEPTQAAVHTRADVALGTPGFMPPEQWAGEPTDARSDQFSFCVALHEGLLGARPFEKSGFSDNKPDFRPPPDVQRLRRELPRGLRRALERGLALEPAQRHASMEPLIRELERALRPWPLRWAALAAGVLVVTAGTTLALQRSPCHGALERIHAVRERALGALPVALAAPVTTAAERFERAWARAWTQACVETNERREQPAEVLALRSECLAKQSRRYELILRQLGDERGDVRATALEALEVGQRPDACLAVEALLSVDQPNPTQREALRSIDERLLEARVLIDVGRYADARASLDALDEPVGRVAFAPTSALHAFLHGYLELREQRLREARPWLRDGFARAVTARDLPLAVRAGSEVVFVSGYALGFLDEAQLVADVSRSLVQRLDDRELEARLENAVGLMAMGQGQLDAARTHLETARALRVEALGADHLDTGKVAGNLGLLALKQGRLDDAEPLLREDRRVREASLGPQHPLVAVALVNLATLATERGQHAEAIALLAQALEIRRAVFAPTHPLVLANSSDLAAAFTAAGRFDEARAQLQALLELARATYGDDSVEVADALDSLADAEASAGATAEALQHARDALTRYRAHLSPREDAVMNERQRVASLLVAMKSYAEAAAQLDQLIAEWRAAPEAQGPLAAALTLRARVRIDQRGGAAALPLLDEALRLATPLDWHPAKLAELHFLLAQAHAQAHHPLEARQHAEAARDGFSRANRPAQRDEVEVWMKAPR